MSNPVSPSLEEQKSVKHKNLALAPVILATDQNAQELASRLLGRERPTFDQPQAIQYNITFNTLPTNPQDVLLLSKIKGLSIESADQEEEPLSLSNQRLQLLNQFAKSQGNPASRQMILGQLSSLIESDPLDGESADKLLQLMVQLLQLVNRDRLQMEVTEVQIELARVFSGVAGLIMMQQAKGNINGITQDLKEKLTDAVEGIKGINRIDSTKLCYYLEMALEGILRVKDDNKVLIEGLKTVSRCTFHLGMVAASYYFTGIDTADELKRVWKSVKTIPTARKSPWYSYTLLLQALTEKAKEDMCYLLLMQQYIAKKGSKLDWRFLYTAVKLLSDVAINGKNSEIRKMALMGNPLTHVPAPGLMMLSETNEFAKSVDFSHLSYFGMPSYTSANAIINLQAINHLIIFVQKSSDDPLKAKVKEFLEARITKETNDEIYNALTVFFNPDSKHESWADDPHGIISTKRGLANRIKRLSGTRDSSRPKQRHADQRYSDPRHPDARSRRKSTEVERRKWNDEG